MTVNVGDQTYGKSSTGGEWSQISSVARGGGHSHYGGDMDVRLQRPPIFSAAVTQ